jgi:DNA mismatch repair ATPase MutS
MYKARVSPLIRDMFERFYQNRDHWSSAVRCMAEIDAFCALAVASSEPMMIPPRIYPISEKPFIRIKQMRHPLIEKKF